MTTQSQLKDLWTRSGEYADKFQREDEIETVVRLLDLEQATELADIGCGNGAFSIAAARAHPQCNVRAFDVLDSAVEEYRARADKLFGERIFVSVGSAESIELPDSSVDRVLCRAVLHHVQDPPRAYGEISRVLRPNGLLLLQTPCNFWQKPWGKVMSDLFMMMDDSHWRQYHRPSEIIDGLSDAGLMMRRAECWTFQFDDLTPQQAQFVRENNAAELFCLKETAGNWSVELYWCRIIASKI